MRSGQTAVQLVLKCIEPSQCSVVFEPYGSEVVLDADDEIRLWITSDDEPRIEVAYSPGCVTVWLPTSIASFLARNRLNEIIDLGLPL